jgi:hypothetical protein
MNNRRIIILSSIIVLSSGLIGCDSMTDRDTFGEPQTKPDAFAIVTVEEDFTLDVPSDAWTFRTSDLWKIETDVGRHFLRLTRPADTEFALYRSFQWRSFSMACYIRCPRGNATGADDGNVGILFGYDGTDRTNRLAFTIAPAQATASLVHSTGVLNRTIKTTVLPTGQTLADGNWHRIDVLRDIDAGTITVRLDAADPGRPALLEIRDFGNEVGLIGFSATGTSLDVGRIMIQGQARKTTPISQTSQD